MDTAFLIAAAVAGILSLTTVLALWQRTAWRDLALLGSLSGISGAGAAALWLE